LLRTATDTSPGRAGEGQGYRVPPPSVRAGGDTTCTRTRYRWPRCPVRRRHRCPGL